MAMLTGGRKEWKWISRTYFRKDEFVPVHVMKENRRSRGIVPRILNLGDRWM